MSTGGPGTLALKYRRARHVEETRRSIKILEDARENAHLRRKYDSTATRNTLVSEFRSRNGGMDPYPWQVDVAEAVLLGLDCTVIAGTGAGKTMPFVMPLFVEKKKVIIIISPLNSLEEDQAERFRKMGLLSVAANGETYDSTDIEDGKYQVVLTSPEMCLKHDGFRRLISSPAFAKRICGIVIDEAHCITQWGEKFRAEYSQLGTLRAFIPTTVPFLVTSATLMPQALAQVRLITHIAASSSYHLNLGVDRPNIAWSVRKMQGGKKDLASLDFLLLPKSIATDGQGLECELTSTMVFFNDINVAMSALQHLRNQLPSERSGEIAVYHSRRTTRAKKRTMSRYMAGSIKILLTTEAAGMGCDLPGVERVVQYMVPASLSIWMQRGGRAGRRPSMLASAILLVQPSVFQKIAVKGNEKSTDKVPGPLDADDDMVTDEVKYQKDVEEGLRKWIETMICRREVFNEYFDSGVESKGSIPAPTGLCCDNCDEMPDNNKTSLATAPINDLVNVGWSIHHAEEHSREISDILKEVDRRELEHRTNEKKRKLDDREAAKAQRQAAKEMERIRKAEANLARKLARRSQSHQSHVTYPVVDLQTPSPQKNDKENWFSNTSPGYWPPYMNTGPSTSTAPLMPYTYPHTPQPIPQPQPHTTPGGPVLKPYQATVPAHLFYGAWALLSIKIMH
ncbi:P-loop containing nucleoside triphosphate hydrolase protein [Infundibulicybe gibba]|nr:P-loop containing nucleoside triphosphate hydrolase protein [Infundibulicybe gibba]